MRLFDIFEDNNNPSDEDLFGEDKSEKIRQAFIDELDNILMTYHEYPGLHRHQRPDLIRNEYAAIQKVRDTFQKNGLLNGLRSLDNPNLSHNIIDHLDAEL